VGDEDVGGDGYGEGDASERACRAAMVGLARILVAHDGGTDRAASGTKKRRGKRGTCDWW
jgi:hypothetical protein